MPTAGRDRRREQRIENAQRWSEWLTSAMKQARVEPKDIVHRAQGAIDKGSVSHWMNGDNAASAEGALIAARILARPPAEALRAAGHDTLADALADVQAESSERIRAYQARIADLEGQLEERLARYGSARAEDPEPVRNHGAS